MTTLILISSLLRITGLIRSCNLEAAESSQNQMLLTSAGQTMSLSQPADEEDGLQTTGPREHSDENKSRMCILVIPRPFWGNRLDILESSIIYISIIHNST